VILVPFRGLSCRGVAENEAGLSYFSLFSAKIREIRGFFHFFSKISIFKANILPLTYALLYRN
jgi:hypothetical protein